MAVTVKNKLIIEDIIDEQGNKLGEIKFNPEDSRIMQKLSKIVNDLSNSLKEMKKLGDIPVITEKDLITIEDFEKEAETFEKINKGFNIELDAVDKTLNDLSEIFGIETINIFTQGTKDIMSIMPLIDYVMPYVKEYREKKVNKYINQKSNVMK